MRRLKILGNVWLVSIVVNLLGLAGICWLLEPEPERIYESLAPSTERMYHIAACVEPTHELSGKRLVLYARVVMRDSPRPPDVRVFFSPYYVGELPSADSYPTTAQQVMELDDPGRFTSFAGRIAGCTIGPPDRYKWVSPKPLLADGLHPEGVVVMMDDFSVVLLEHSELEGGVVRFGPDASHPLLRCLSDK